MKELQPIIFDTLKDYDKKQFVSDLVAGVIVAIIALPLSIALALASGVGPEQGIYTAIFAQYMAILVYDCGQTQYLPFLEKNIITGWANRDKSRNIIDGEYHKRTAPYENVDSYEASGIPALMLLFPPQE